MLDPTALPKLLSEPLRLPQQHPGVPLVSTEVLREKIRKYSRRQRDSLRAQQTDAVRFGLGEIQAEIKELENLTEKDVNGLATRIKRRKHATMEDMYRLSHAFLQGPENIITFANIPGAMQVIVKELTGRDAARQVSASECLCNMSLGEVPVCDKIASMAGSYLVTYLNSTEERLKRTSLWTLANLLATGGKGAQALVQMELLPKLWGLYLADSGTLSEDYAEDAGICLQQICCHDKKFLRQSDKVLLQQNFSMKNPTCSAGEYHLQILFHSEIIQPNCTLNAQQLLYLINYALSNLSQSADFVTTANRLRVLYAVRILANLAATQTQTLQLLLHQMTTVWQMNLVLLLNKLFAYRNAALTRETFWLLQNLLQYQQQQGTFVQNSDSLLEKLQVFQSENMADIGENNTVNTG